MDGNDVCVFDIFMYTIIDHSLKLRVWCLF